jgi:hypothetical protein
MGGANSLHDSLLVVGDRMFLDNDNLGLKGRNNRHVGHESGNIDGKARHGGALAMRGGPGHTSFTKPNDRAKSGDGARNVVANGSSRASKHEHSGSEENTKLNAPAHKTGLNMHAQLPTTRGARRVSPRAIPPSSVAQFAPLRTGERLFDRPDAEDSLLALTLLAGEGPDAAAGAEG